MQKFTDTENNVWDVDIDLPAAQRVRRLADLNILAADGSQGIVATFDDPLALGEALYAVCQPQADKRDVTQAAFIAAIKGDVLTEARTAFR